MPSCHCVLQPSESGVHFRSSLGLCFIWSHLLEDLGVRFLLPAIVSSPVLLILNVCFFIPHCHFNGISREDRDNCVTGMAIFHQKSYSILF